MPMIRRLPEPGIVIVGGGYAAYSFFSHFRKKDTSTPLTILSRELYPCYDRRQLRKVMNGSAEAEDLLFLPLQSYEDAGVEFAINRRVVTVDRKRHLCFLTNDEKIPYDKLIIATGATANRLNVLGSTLPGVFYFREVRSAIEIRRYIKTNRIKNAVVVGAGPLGIELACSLRSIARRVFLLHKHPFPLENYLDEHASYQLIRVLKDLGIILQFNNEVTSFLGSKRVENVDCRNGQSLPADLVLLCTGSVCAPSLIDDDLPNPDGIPVNTSMQTADPDIFAIGDAANIPGIIRRSYLNASITARIVADQLINLKQQKKTNALPAQLKHIPLSINIKNLSLLSMGNVLDPGLERHIFTRPEINSYSSVFYSGRNILGGIFINDNAFASRFIQAFTNRKPLDWLLDQAELT